MLPCERACCTFFERTGDFKFASYAYAYAFAGMCIEFQKFNSNRNRYPRVNFITPYHQNGNSNQ